jgi:hypothetical protein
MKRQPVKQRGLAPGSKLEYAPDHTIWYDWRWDAAWNTYDTSLLREVGKICRRVLREGSIKGYGIGDICDSTSTRGLSPEQRAISPCTGHEPHRWSEEKKADYRARLRKAKGKQPPKMKPSTKKERKERSDAL